jgi:hypothetical protein
MPVAEKSNSCASESLITSRPRQLGTATEPGVVKKIGQSDGMNSRHLGNNDQTCNRIEQTRIKTALAQPSVNIISRIMKESALLPTSV